VCHVEAHFGGARSGQTPAQNPATWRSGQHAHDANCASGLIREQQTMTKALRNLSVVAVDRALSSAKIVNRRLRIRFIGRYDARMNA
jgi:hypothetical protein